MKAALIALALLATPATADTNLLVNGDFFGGTYASTGTVAIGGPARTVTKEVPIGWVANSAYYYIYNFTVPGSVVLGNNGGEPVPTISQTFSDTPNTSYLVTFHLTGYMQRPSGWFFDADINGITELAINDQYFSTSFDSQFSFTFVGTGSETITLGGVNSIGSYRLSDVSVTAIPEPSTWGLLLFGFAFLGMREIWPGAEHE